MALLRTLIGAVALVEADVFTARSSLDGNGSIHFTGWLGFGELAILIGLWYLVGNPENK